MLKMDVSSKWVLKLYLTAPQCMGHNNGGLLTCASFKIVKLLCSKYIDYKASDRHNLVLPARQIAPGIAGFSNVFVSSVAAPRDIMPYWLQDNTIWVAGIVPHSIVLNYATKLLLRAPHSLGFYDQNRNANAMLSALIPTRNIKTDLFKSTDIPIATET